MSVQCPIMSVKYLYNVCIISQNVSDHVLERFRSLFNGFEHSKLYVDGIGLGYLLGPTLRAPYGANNLKSSIHNRVCIFIHSELHTFSDMGIAATNRHLKGITVWKNTVKSTYSVILSIMNTNNLYSYKFSYLVVIQGSVEC